MIRGGISHGVGTSAPRGWRVEGPLGLTACVGRGPMVPDVGGPTHRYLGASPWRCVVYREVLLAREQSRVVHAL